jgi:hypothetical protein
MAGRWDAGIVSPGGLISFGLEMVNREGIWSAAIFNGVEKIAIPSVEVRGNHLELAMPHYDSTIKAAFDPERQTIGGTWKKRRGRDEWVWMKMQGTRSQEKNFDAPENFVGRWKSDSNPVKIPQSGFFALTRTVGKSRERFLPPLAITGTFSVESETVSCH